MRNHEGTCTEHTSLSANNCLVVKIQKIMCMMRKGRFLSYYQCTATLINKYMVMCYKDNRKPLVPGIKLQRNISSFTLSDNFILQANRSCNLRVKRKNKHWGQGLSGLERCVIGRQFQFHTSYIK